jgi:hypothetical protein
MTCINGSHMRGETTCSMTLSVSSRDAFSNGEKVGVSKRALLGIMPTM